MLLADKICHVIEPDFLQYISVFRLQCAVYTIFLGFQEAHSNEFKQVMLVAARRDSVASVGSPGVPVCFWTATKTLGSCFPAYRKHAFWAHPSVIHV